MEVGSKTRVLVCVIALFATTTAAAQPSVSGAATVQFERGRTLMKDGKYKEACAAFAQSQKLDPQNGTLYNMAGCYMKLGKLATAWATYHELAKSDSNVKRRADSAKREKELEPRLSKLLIEVDGNPPGLVVTMDGLDVTGLVNAPTPVDLGTYQIEGKASGRPDARAIAKVVDERKTVKVSLDFDDNPDPGHVVKEPVVKRTTPVDTTVDRTADRSVERPDRRDATEPAPKSKRRTYGVVSMVGGGALIATGLFFGKQAGSKWDEAKTLCGSDLACENPADVERGNALADSAKSKANLATVLVISGGVGVAIGAVLYFKAPSATSSRTALRLTPGAGDALAGVTLGGHF